MSEDARLWGVLGNGLRRAQRPSGGPHHQSDGDATLPWRELCKEWTRHAPTPPARAPRRHGKERGGKEAKKEIRNGSERERKKSYHYKSTCKDDQTKMVSISRGRSHKHQTIIYYLHLKFSLWKRFIYDFTVAYDDDNILSFTNFIFFSLSIFLTKSWI